MILLKKFISFLLFFILVFLALNVYAAEDSSENPTVNIKYDYSSVVSWFSGGLGLGDFSGIEEHSYLKISFTLDYDSSLLRYIDINPGNNWTLLSSEDSNNFVLETNDAMPNTFIININFYPDPSVENLEELHYVYFENIVVTNNSNLNENYDGFSIPLTYSPSPPSFEKPTNEINNGTSNGQANTNEIVNSNTEITNNIIQNGQNQNNNFRNDSTTATTRLPNTGITRILVITIFILIISSIYFKIKSKDIKY